MDNICHGSSFKGLALAKPSRFIRKKNTSRKQGAQNVTESLQQEECLQAKAAYNHTLDEHEDFFC